MVLIRQPLVIAHRGASGTTPENTRLSIQTAMVSQADLIEVDVQITKDSQVVLFHDRTLERITGINQTIMQTSYRELCQLDVGKWMDTRFNGSIIPKLEDILDLTNGKGMIIEIKPDPSRVENDRILENTVLTLLDNSKGIGNGYISVRNIKTLEWFRSQDCGYRIGLMQKKRTSKELFNLIEEYKLEIVQTRALQFTDKDYKKLSKYDVESYVYWADSPQEWDYLCKQPINGILTNFPAIMRAHIEGKIHDKVLN